MSKLIWDSVGERFYENGVDHGVLYLLNTDNNTYDSGVSWNGLISVAENPSGGESNPQYADNIKYLDLLSKEDFGATVTCFTYPTEWELCDGTVSPVAGMTIGQQSRKTFGLSYRTLVGNDLLGNDYAYKLHLVYNGTASPSERDYQTVNDSPDALEFSWEIDTTPVTLTTKVDGKTLKATSILTIDSSNFTTTALRAKLDTLEAALFGTDADPEDPQSVATDPYLPDPDTVISMLSAT